MKIIQANLADTDKIHEIIKLIYDVFSECNVVHSTQRLIQRMEKLYGPGYDYEYTLAHFKKSNVFFIAKEENMIVGVVRWTSEKLSNLYISGKQQWKGLGKLLLQKFEEEAKKLWSTTIRLKSSKYALPFYIKNGYTIEQENRLIKYF